MEQNDASNKCLFLRVWYREKCKLRSFECFPSFKELVHEITTIYPDVKDQVSVQSSRRKKSEDDKKSNRETFEWRLVTNEGEWIETKQDWNTLVQFITSSKGKVGEKVSDQKSNGHRYKLRSGSKSNGHAVKGVDDDTHSGDGDKSLHLSLRLVIEDPSKTPYNPSAPTFEACLKNPLTLLYQRPPPPPYQPGRAGPPPFGSAHPMYGPPAYGHPPPHYGAPYPHPSMVVPPRTHPQSPMSNGHGARRLFHDGSPEQPPVKKRKLSETPSTPTSAITANGANGANVVNGATVATVPGVAGPLSGSAAPMTPGALVTASATTTTAPTSDVAVTLLPLPATPATIPMPSGPPPKDKLDANPYGLVYMDGHVWCDACNKWCEVHTFDSHLMGQKHKKNIDEFAFRKVLKHWQSVRTKVVDDLSKYNISELSVNDNLWYAQTCMGCLAQVIYASWHQHVRGQVHQNNFAKSPRCVTLKRSLPPGNVGTNEIPTLFDQKYFIQISNYVPGSKILVLGEQDFSYSLAVCSKLGNGTNLVGTSYLGAFDANAPPEEHPKDDGVRTNYFRKTLPSHSGKLQENLASLTRMGAHVAHSIDATKLWDNLNAVKPSIYCGPFDIICFPFPRASLKRGNDFRNSALVQGFFYELNTHRNELLYPLSQIQMICLDNQFADWDIANIARENGWVLKWRCAVDFSVMPLYQPREMSGKAWSGIPKDARLLVFLWDSEFDEKKMDQLKELNKMNDMALLPDEAMKVTKQAKIMDAYHANGIRQFKTVNS